MVYTPTSVSVKGCVTKQKNRKQAEKGGDTGGSINPLYWVYVCPTGVVVKGGDVVLASNRGMVQQQSNQ